jgi:hypothetical protein
VKEIRGRRAMIVKEITRRSTSAGWEVVAPAPEASWWCPGERRCKGRATRGEAAGWGGLVLFWRG